MKSLFKSTVGALLVGAALCTPALADGNDGDRDTVEMDPGQTFDSGSDADKQIARAKAVMKTLESILGDCLSFGAIKGEARKEMIKGMYEIIRDEKFKARSDGKFKYSAVCSRNEAEQIVMTNLKVEETFGAQQFMIVACPTQWFEGPIGDGADKLSERSAKTLGESVAKACSEFLMHFRFRKAPAANNTENVAKAAQDLGTDPQTAQLSSFARMFDVPVVCSVQGTIVFEQAMGTDAQANRGTLQCSQLAARLYHKDSQTVLAEFEIKMARPRRILGMNGVTADNCKMDSFPTAFVGTQQTMRNAVEEYAQVIGLVLGKALCKKLADVYYANQPAPQPAGGAAASGPRKCPGCGDTILSAEPKKCPACDSDLPAATGGGGAAPAGGGAAFRNPGPTDHYELRLVNWQGGAGDEFVEALQGQKTGWGNFKEGDAQGNIRVFKCTFVGEMIVKQVNMALEDMGKKSTCTVQKSGNTITITKNN